MKFQFINAIKSIIIKNVEIMTKSRLVEVSNVFYDLFGKLFNL